MASDKCIILCHFSFMHSWSQDVPSLACEITLATSKQLNFNSQTCLFSFRVISARVFREFYIPVLHTLLHFVKNTSIYLCFQTTQLCVENWYIRGNYMIIVFGPAVTAKLPPVSWTHNRVVCILNVYGTKRWCGEILRDWLQGRMTSARTHGKAVAQHSHRRLQFRKSE